MNIFFKNKKQSKSDEFEVIHSDNKVAESTPSIVNSLLSDKEEISPKSTEADVEDSEETYSNKLYEYSTSLMESISLNMYSESGHEEFKTSTMNFLKHTWGKIKTAYDYVSELNEDYIINELQKGTIFEQTRQGYYREAGLDVSI